MLKGFIHEIPFGLDSKYLLKKSYCLTMVKISTDDNPWTTLELNGTSASRSGPQRSSRSCTWPASPWGRQRRRPREAGAAYAQQQPHWRWQLGLYRTDFKLESIVKTCKRLKILTFIPFL